MIKIKKNLKYITFFLLIYLTTLLLGTTTYDFNISYDFSYNLSKGLIPYKDFNMIVPPLTTIMGSLFLKLFGNGIHIYILFSSLISTAIIYWIFKIYKNKAWYSVILFFIPFQIYNLSCCYNICLILFMLILIYLENKENSNNYLIGLVLALSFFTKQTIGVLYILVNIIINIKNKKKLLQEFIGFIAITSLFLIYFLVTNSLYDFIDQAFLGMFSFSSKNNYSKGIFFYLTLTMYLINIIFLIKDKNKMHLYLLAYLFINTPLYDDAHFFTTLPIFILLFEKYLKPLSIKTENYLLLFILIFFSCNILKNFQNSYTYPTGIKHYQYLYIPKEEIKTIKTINNYISKNKDKYNIHIFDSKVFLFKISNNLKSDKYLDTMNYGNMGLNGSINAINEIKSFNKNKNIYLINLDLINNLKNAPRSQLDRLPIDYVIKHGKKLGTVGYFTIYQIK